jgi:hypothetical protein
MAHIFAVADMWAHSSLGTNTACQVMPSGVPHDELPAGLNSLSINRLFLCFTNPLSAIFFQGSSQLPNFNAARQTPQKEQQSDVYDTGRNPLQ